MVRRAFKMYATTYRQKSYKCISSVIARLLFCNLVSMTDLNKLQVAQNEAARCCHGYLTRHPTGARFVLPKAKINVRKKFVLYRTIVGWNSSILYFVLENSKVRYKFLLQQFLIMMQQQ